MFCFSIKNDNAIFCHRACKILNPIVLTPGGNLDAIAHMHFPSLKYMEYANEVENYTFTKANNLVLKADVTIERNRGGRKKEREERWTEEGERIEERKGKSRKVRKRKKNRKKNLNR